MICSKCLKGRYQTIKRLFYLSPGHPAQVEASWCPKCNDIIYTHKQGLAIDKLKKKMLEK